MDRQTMRACAAEARVGHLATVGADGSPHIVPVCFCLVNDTAYTAVDRKPKRSRHLRRVANLQATRRCCLLLDRYDDDWSRLWWVRLDAHGRVVDDAREQTTALTALADKYPQYDSQPPTGPVLGLDIVRWTGWSATWTSDNG